MKPIKERSAKRTRVPGKNNTPIARAREEYLVWDLEDVSAALEEPSLRLDDPLVASEGIERLNDILSDYLWCAMPGTQDREGQVRRYNWYGEVSATAQRLRALLEHVEDSALLLSGVGQPLLWISTTGRPRLTYLDWRNAISRIQTDCDLVFRASEGGRETLARDLMRTATTNEGRIEVSDQRRQGRPSTDHWKALAEGLFSFWHFLAGKEASVTVNPETDPPTRSSDAASFVAALLNAAAKKLPADKSWAAPQLLNQEKRLIAFLEERQRPLRRKREKSRTM
jgi:hypothetical protein